MRVLLVGLGSIGKRHVTNLKFVDPSAHVIVWHHQRKKGLGAISYIGVDEETFSLEEALKEIPDVAFISGPAPEHISKAMPLADKGIHLFVEKPLSDTKEGVEELLRLVKYKDLVLLVGYNLRFSRSLQVARKALMEGRVGRLIALRAHVGQYLPQWRSGSDYRRSVSARRDLGGGVLLELSHELDYLRWLGGEVKGVSAQVAHLSDLKIDVEDVAEITLLFAQGAIGEVHMNMVQRPAMRKCMIVGTKGTLTWDGLSHEVRICSGRSERWEELHPPNIIDQNAMYIEEIRHFFACVRGTARPLVTGEDGKRVLEIALAAKEAARSQRTIYL
jgi:predicted dehydrogenase